MLPVHARLRRPLIEERLDKLAAYAETFPDNRIIWGERHLGVVSSGVAYQYAREVFPNASFLKLGMTYPLPQNLLREFAAQVDRIIVVEELDPFLQENILAMGIKVTGKEFIPRIGELNPGIIERSWPPCWIVNRTFTQRKTTYLRVTRASTCSVRRLPTRWHILCAQHHGPAV